MSDWDEIKRLAADFQKVQLSSTLQKLSERNCVEIVTLLIQKGLLDVIYTNDGKEYLTYQHLTSEVQDELYCRGGRVNLVELAKTLNVDLSQVNKVAEEIAAQDKKLHLILGQLIDENYIQRIASEINEKLIQNGEISVSQLTEQFDLPSNFIQKFIMEKHLGTTIHGRQDSQDPKIFFTLSYVARCRAKLRGALAAITKPTPVTAILSQSGVHERIFFTIIDDVCTAGAVTSKSTGAQYIPHIYTKTQVDWVQTFYKQNGYLEFDSVAGLGVSDPKGFIQRQLPKENLLNLDKCTIGPRITDIIESALEECVSTGGYLDVSTVLPSIMSEEDIDQLLKIVLSPAIQKSTLLLGTTVLTTQFLDQIVKPCNEVIQVNAKQSVVAGKYQQFMAERQMGTNKNQDLEIDSKMDKREDRRKKAASGKAGGGAQGRETKTKSTKKHFRGGKGHESDSDDDQDYSGKKKGNQSGLELITLQEIRKVLIVGLEPEGLEDLSKQLASHFYPQFSKEALVLAQGFFEATLQNNNQNRRQTHSAIQDKLNNLLNDIRLYEKGLKVLSADLQPQLVKYLLKSLGGDFANEIAFYIACECALTYNDSSLTQEQRTKISQDCTPEYKSALTTLNKSILGTSIEDFFTIAENSLQVCSMILKKVDKKKDRTIIHAHKLGLLNQITSCSDPALVLHLVVLVIFTVSTQNMLHASGRHVSSILSFLQPVLSSEQYSSLSNYHDAVLKFLSSGPDSDDGKEAAKKLDDLMSVVKEIANSYKKVGVTSTE